ncbi:MAG: hypothetical protein LQ340_000030 [Diploschistes diacapsis]|nr:MAG: hypothetical protein LQ340_000030 [Diploschistes diacapsis]
MPRSYDTNTTADVLVKEYASVIKGKVILTTGVSPGGLGAFFVENIANKATADAISKINPKVQTRTLQLDLESLRGVKEAAATVSGWDDVPQIDVLVNNAGIMACEYAKTEDALERQFATSHVGPFLFTNLIMKKLLASSAPRIVNVSSDGHRLSWLRWPDIGFSDGKLYNKWRAYGQGKTANILFTTSLAKKLGPKGLVSVSLHPGVIGTHLGDHLDWNVEFAGLQGVDKELGNKEGFSAGFDFKTPERGVATHVYAAFEPSLKDHNGSYLQDSHIADPYVDTIKPYAQDAVEANRLWSLSEEIVGQKFEY